jgi:hypothetical protein
MKSEERYHSYLVRLWQDEMKPKQAENPRWRGEVIHIQTGQSRRVQDLKPLLDLLRNLTNQDEA